MLSQTTLYCDTQRVNIFFFQKAKAKKKEMSGGAAATSNNPRDWTTKQINNVLAVYPQPKDPNFKFPKTRERAKRKLRHLLAK